MIMKILQRQLLIKQTLFGISWLGVGALLPYAQPMAPAFSFHTWLFMILGFVSCRFAGMSLNRLIDHSYDAMNPRTKDRPLPKGELSIKACIWQSALFLTIFLVAAWAINPLCGALSVIIGALVFLYSFTKRFTKLCHFVLGSVHFFAPVCAWAAITGEVTLAPIFLGLSLFFSIAAGDIIYACQDLEFDREVGLYSIPAAMGAQNACLFARVLHVASVICLWSVSQLLGSPMLFLATSLVACLYASSHVKLARGDFGHEAMFAFINTVSGVILFIFTLGEMAWHASW